MNRDVEATQFQHVCACLMVGCLGMGYAAKVTLLLSTISNLITPWSSFLSNNIETYVASAMANTTVDWISSNAWDHRWRLAFAGAAHLIIVMMVNFCVVRRWSYAMMLVYLGAILGSTYTCMRWNTVFRIDREDTFMFSTYACFMTAVTVGLVYFSPVMYNTTLWVYRWLTVVTCRTSAPCCICDESSSLAQRHVGACGKQACTQCAVKWINTTPAKQTWVCCDRSKDTRLMLPHELEALRQWKSTLASTDATYQLQFNERRCPKCRIPIFRYDGCPHMTCFCGYEFCWYCEFYYYDCVCFKLAQERQRRERQQREIIKRNTAPIKKKRRSKRL